MQLYVYAMAAERYSATIDVNIRSATLLGIVGAGGIGFDLLSGAQILEFGLVTTI